jgi:hypothetical protein
LKSKPVQWPLTGGVLMGLYAQLVHRNLNPVE